MVLREATTIVMQLCNSCDENEDKGDNDPAVNDKASKPNAEGENEADKGARDSKGIKKRQLHFAARSRRVARERNLY
jgi:hypothetical protein